MIFPNWGAISANIINAQNRKSIGVLGKYKPTRKPNKKDWVVGILLMITPAIIIWLVFIIIMHFTN